MQHHLSIYTELPFYLWDSVLNKSLTCWSPESPIKKHKQGLLCPHLVAPVACWESQSLRK